MSIIEHSPRGDTPAHVGVYACRVDDPENPPFLMDAFLVWIDNQWCYLSSDQVFRGKVHGWVGPIPRQVLTADGRSVTFPP